MKRGVVGAIALALVAAGGLSWTVWRRGLEPGTPVISGGDERIIVEVLNATDVDGLAREVTRRLRRAGIDVVYVGASPGPQLAATRILVRRGDSSAAVTVRRVLGLGRVTLEPDARLLLDVSVLLGTDAARPVDRRP